MRVYEDSGNKVFGPAIEHSTGNGWYVRGKIHWKDAPAKFHQADVPVVEQVNVPAVEQVNESKECCPKCGSADIQWANMAMKCKDCWFTW
jgi:hypothetical protein